MAIIVWCVIGAVLAAISITVWPQPGISSRVEAVLVGMFGAVIGGEFPLAAVAATGVQPASLGLAFLGGVLMLSLLALMRRVVGPLKPSAKRKAPRI